MTTVVESSVNYLDKMDELPVFYSEKDHQTNLKLTAHSIRNESSLYRYNPDHRWFYFSHMRPEEAIVFKAFDSDRSRVQGCPHSAFDDPSCPQDVVPRASVEIRAYVYFG